MHDPLIQESNLSDSWDENQFILLTIGDIEIALPADCIGSIIDLGDYKVSRLPFASEELLGIFYLKGKIVSLIDNNYFLSKGHIDIERQKSARGITLTLDSDLYAIPITSIGKIYTGMSLKESDLTLEILNISDIHENISKFKDKFGYEIDKEKVLYLFTNNNPNPR